MVFRPDGLLDATWGPKKPQDPKMTPKRPQHEPKMKPFGSKFSEKVRNRKSVFGLRRRVRIAYEPIPWSAQGNPKIEEKN